MKSNQSWPHLQFTCCLKTGFFDKDGLDKPLAHPSKNPIVNRHQTRPCSSQKIKKPDMSSQTMTTKSANQYCLGRLGSKTTSKRIAFFTNPLPASKLAELEDLSTSSTEHNSKKDKTGVVDKICLGVKKEGFCDLFKNSNVHDFDAIFCDQNIRTGLYGRTFEQAAQRVFAGQNSTVLVVGERDTRRKARFFLSGTSLFQKFMVDVQAKFEIFQRGEDNECCIDRKVSVFGLFGHRMFDFLKGGEKAESAKISKTGLNTRADMEEFVDKLRATFNVSKTLSYKQKSILLVIKVFFSVRDKCTKIKLRSSEVNFIVADSTHFDKGLMSDLRESLVQGTTSSPLYAGSTRITDLRQSGDVSSKERTCNLNDSNRKLLTTMFAVDSINVYFCLNAAFKHADDNRRLLEYYKQTLNELRLIRTLSPDKTQSPFDATTSDLRPVNTKGQLKLSQSNGQLTNPVKLQSNIEFFERTLAGLEAQVFQHLSDSTLNNGKTHMQQIENMLQVLVYDFNELQRHLSKDQVTRISSRIQELRGKIGLDNFGLKSQT